MRRGHLMCAWASSSSPLVSVPDASHFINLSPISDQISYLPSLLLCPPFPAMMLLPLAATPHTRLLLFLPPQVRRPGENAEMFASRVQPMIADAAKLRVVPWDGYLKYYNLGEKNPGLIETRRRVLADVLRGYLSTQ